MGRGIDTMDEPLRRAVAIAGGRRPFFRLLGLGRPGWRTTPRDRLFEVAAISGIPPQELRPDQADWIAAEISRRQQAGGAGGVSLVALGADVDARWDGPTLEEGLVDLWSCMAAVAFVGRERGLKAMQVYCGERRFEENARAYAMALAKVCGRARSTHIANVFQCARQNVDNAAERYLRARDGDDPDDYIRGQFQDGKPRVFEIGSNRLRHAKTATEGLWAAQQRFEAFLGGQTLTLPEPKQRRRA